MSRAADQWAPPAWCPAEPRGQTDGPSGERLAQDRGGSVSMGILGIQGCKAPEDHLSASVVLSCVVSSVLSQKDLSI